MPRQRRITGEIVRGRTDRDSNQGRDSELGGKGQREYE